MLHFKRISKVSRPLDEFLCYHTGLNDVMVVLDDLMAAERDPW